MPTKKPAPPKPRYVDKDTGVFVSAKFAKENPGQVKLHTGPKTPNPKGNKASLIPGVNPNKNENLRPDEPWEGPAAGMWEELLNRVASGENYFDIVTNEWPVDPSTVGYWRKRNGLDEELHEAFRTRVKMMPFEILEIVDNPAGDTSRDVQRDRIRAEYRFKTMQALDARFRPKQDTTIDLSQATTDLLLETLKKLA